MLTLLRCALVLIPSLYFSIAAVGQEPSTRPTPVPPAAVEPDYWLRVTGDNVNIRSRPDTNSLILSQVGRDAVLHGRGEQFEWHQVDPPADVFCFVAKQYVETTGEGLGAVRIASGTLRVRAGSQLFAVEPAQSEVVARLENGTEVAIVGEEGDWLKIRPPASVPAYVSADYAERIAEDRAAELRAQVFPTTAVAARTTETPATRPAPSPQATAEEWSRRLAQIETAIQAETRKPVPAQDWAGFLKRFEPLAQQTDSVEVARIARAWQRELAARRTGQEDLARRRSTAGDWFLRATEMTRPEFAARGLLLLSVAHERAPRIPLYKLVDPASYVTVAYLRWPAGSLIDPNRHVGRYVGVKGAARFDLALGASVVSVTELVLLEPTESDAAEPRGTDGG